MSRRRRKLNKLEVAQLGQPVRRWVTGAFKHRTESTKGKTAYSRKVKNPNSEREAA